MECQQKVLSLIKKIPCGKVTTYGIIAKKLKSSPQIVGQALKRNKTAFLLVLSTVNSQKTSGEIPCAIN